MEIEERKRLQAQYVHYADIMSKTMMPAHPSPYGVPMNLGFSPHPFAAMFQGGLPSANAVANFTGLNLSHAQAAALSLSPHASSMPSPYNIPPRSTATSSPSTSNASISRNTGMHFIVARAPLSTRLT